MKKTFLVATLFVLVSGFAYAQVPADKDRPCKANREQFCGDVKPGQGRIIKCLKAHEKDLSPACKEKLAEMKKRYQEEVNKEKVNKGKTN